LGIGDWAQSPIPNPQSPIPNPQIINSFKAIFLFKLKIFYFNKNNNYNELNKHGIINNQNIAFNK
jgi:hypothetical protein